MPKSVPDRFTFCEVAAQIIPVFLLTLVIELRLYARGERERLSESLSASASYPGKTLGANETVIRRRPRPGCSNRREDAQAIHG